jgi:hypothetical protein
VATSIKWWPLAGSHALTSHSCPPSKFGGLVKPPPNDKLIAQIGLTDPRHTVSSHALEATFHRSIFYTMFNELILRGLQSATTTNIATTLHACTIISPSPRTHRAKPPRTFIVDAVDAMSIHLLTRLARTFSKTMPPGGRSRHCVIQET